MGFIKLTSVSFVVPPSGAQFATVQYRKSSDPDMPSFWTTALSMITIQPNGDIAPDLTISGLQDGISYVVRIIPSCGGAHIDRTYSTGSTTTTLPPDRVYYGTRGVDGAVPNPAEIVTGSNFLTTASGDVAINWGAGVGAPRFYWLAIPANSTAHLKDTWYQSPLNNGSMGGVEDLFGSPTVLTVNSMLYYVWITNYPTELLNTNYIFSRYSF